MEELKIVYKPIGVIRNDFSKPEDTKEIRNSQSQLIVSEKYLPALEGTDNASTL